MEGEEVKRIFKVSLYSLVVSYIFTIVYYHIFEKTLLFFHTSLLIIILPITGLIVFSTYGIYRGYIFSVMIFVVAIVYSWIMSNIYPAWGESGGFAIVMLLALWIVISIFTVPITNYLAKRFYDINLNKYARYFIFLLPYILIILILALIPLTCNYGRDVSCKIERSSSSLNLDKCFSSLDSGDSRVCFERIISELNSKNDLNISFCLEKTDEIRKEKHLKDYDAMMFEYLCYYGLASAKNDSDLCCQIGWEWTSLKNRCLIDFVNKTNSGTLPQNLNINELIPNYC